MANKETRVLKSNTFEEFRQKTNEVSLHLGDNEQLSSNLSDSTYNYNNVGVGATIFKDTDDSSSAIEFDLKIEETLDNTGGYIILTGSPSITGFDAGVTLTQTGGYSATIVSASTSKILVKNSTGTFNTSQNLVAGSNSITASKVQRIIAEAYPKGLLRVYKNGVEIPQNLDETGFHVINYSAKIALSNNPTVTDFTEGSTVYQGNNLASATFSGTVLRATSTELTLKNHTGSFNAGTQIKLDGSSSNITGSNHGDINPVDTTVGNGIELNTPITSATDDIKIFSMNIVEAVNELQDDVGITENLNTQSGNLVGAINEIEAVFDASDRNITTGSDGFTIQTGTFVADIDGDITLDAGGSQIFFKQNGTQFGELQNQGGNLKLSSGSTTMLTGNGADATFAQDVSVTRDVGINRNLDVDGVTTLDETTIDGNLDLNGSVDVSVNATVHGNLDVDGATTLDGTTIDGNLDLNGNVDVSGTSDLHGAVEMNSTLGVDGNLRVGSNKFNVTASSGNTQIDGTLEVDGTAGIDGNLRVGADKFNVTAATGNTQIDGTLNVDGATTLDGTTIDGDLDLNGNADISTNLTVGGVLDIGTLNNKFTNTNNVKLALNELHDELGNAVITGTGTPADGQSNITNAVNAIDAEIGSTGYIGSTITFALDAAQDYIGTYSNTVSSTITGALNQLHTELGSSSLTDNLPSDFTYTTTDHTTAINTMSSFIGNTSIANIGTTDTVTGALQKLHAEIGDSDLSVFAATDISAALRELESEKVYLTSGSRQTLDSQLNLDRNITFRAHSDASNTGMFTFNTGTTLDLSNASLLLPGNSSNVNIFSTSFLEVDGNVPLQGFSVDRQSWPSLTDKNDVQLQWDEEYADGTNASRPARAWRLKGLNDSATTNVSDITTFYNAKELFNIETTPNGYNFASDKGIKAYWDATNQKVGFDVNDPTLTFTGDVTGSGTLTNLGNLSIALTVQPNSVALGTDTTGNYIETLTGTQYQVTVTPSGHSEGKDAVLSIPSDFRMPGTAKVLGTTGSSSATTGALTVAGGVGIGEDLYVAGDLYVEGTRTELNVTTLEVEDTLILTGTATTEPSSGGFGIETKSFNGVGTHSNAASNVTGSHSIVYNFATDRWEADGSLILSEATLGVPDVAAASSSNFELSASKRLHFNAGTGIGVAATASGNDIDIEISNTLDGYSGWFLYEDNNNRGNVGDDSIVDFRSGTVMDIAYDNATSPTRKRLTFNHANVGLSTATATDTGAYIQSINVSAQGHVTGITSGNFSDDYDNYGSWTFKEGNGDETGTIGSGQELHFEQGTGIEVEKTADRQLTITNTDKGSDQHIYKSVATDSGTATADSNTDTLTIAGGSSLATERNGDTVTINHTSVGAASVDNSGVTFIQDLTIDTNGHVTGTESATVPAPGDGTVTVEAGTLLSLGANQDGIFTMNQSSDDSITINHDDVSRTDATSTSSPGYAGTFTAIDSVTTSDQGHVSGVNLKTVTMPSAQSIGNGTITIAGGTALKIDETDNDFSTNQGTNQTITVSHDNTARANNTSTASPGYAGTFTAIDSVTSDARGHITAVNTKTVTMPSAQSIPTVNNGTLTFSPEGYLLTRNGSGNYTSGDLNFTANQSSNETWELKVNADTASSNSTIVARDASGDVYADVYHSDDLAQVATSNIGGILVNEGGTFKKASSSQIISYLGQNFTVKAPSNLDDSTGQQIGAGSTLIISGGDGITTSRSGGIITIEGSGTDSDINTSGATVIDQLNMTGGIITSHTTRTLTKSDLSLDYTDGADITPSWVPSSNPNYVTSSGVTSVATGNGLSGGTITSTGTLTMSGSYTGTFTASGDVVAYSDERLKDNIETLDGSKVFDMRGVTFTRNDEDGRQSSGVIAQELEKLAPELITEAEDGTKGVSYGNIAGYLIEAIKLLKEENEQIRSELESLKSINR